MFRYFKRVKILSQIIDEKNILLVEMEQRIIGLEEENAKLRKAYNICDEANIDLKEKIKTLRKELNERSYVALEEELTEAKQLVEKYRQAVDKCLHITFMGGGCEVNTIGQYATLVDGYLTDVEGLAKWKN